MLQQSGDWQIHLLAMDDHPILGNQTKPPVDPVILQYYTLMQLHNKTARQDDSAFTEYFLTECRAGRLTVKLLSQDNIDIEKLLFY